MSMSRKDYRLLATVIKQALDSTPPYAKDGNDARAYRYGIRDVAQLLAADLEHDNLRFRKDIFYAHAGLDEEGDLPFQAADYYGQYGAFLDNVTVEVYTPDDEEGPRS